MKKMCRGFINQDYEEEALNFIRENLSDKGKIFVAFSGGKDSICIAELMRKSGIDYQLYYSFTGIDPPEIVRNIRKNYPDCIFLKPKETFWKTLFMKFPASRKTRWCCDLLKKNQSKKIDLNLRVFGIRAEESFSRSKYLRIEKSRIKKKWLLHYPIFHWKEWHIWDYIEKNNLPVSDIYNYFDRIGCIICPFHSQKLHFRYRDRWPGYFDLFEKTVKKNWYSKLEKGYTFYYDNPESFLNAWYKDSMAPFYKGNKEKITLLK